MYNFKEKKRFFDNLMNAEAAEADLKLLVAAAPGNSNLSTYKRNPRRYAGDILYALLDYRSADDIRLNRRKQTEKSGEGGEPKAPASVLVPETQKEDKPIVSEAPKPAKSSEKKTKTQTKGKSKSTKSTRK